MTKVVGAFENSNIKRYEALYDEQLKFVRQYLCNMMNQYPKKAKQWLLSEVAAEQEDVPLIVVKAANDTIKIIDDENVIKDCVQTSKKINGIKAYPSKTSKQNWHIDLTCRTHTTTLNFSIRTNKTGINHKLGQYVNLAVKFNGLKKK
jgi:tRNA uridine 5-carbamoylmethylation protein Kti12